MAAFYTCCVEFLDLEVPMEPEPKVLEDLQEDGQEFKELTDHWNHYTRQSHTQIQLSLWGEPLRTGWILKFMIEGMKAKIEILEALLLRLNDKKQDFPEIRKKMNDKLFVTRLELELMNAKVRDMMTGEVKNNKTSQVDSPPIITID